MTADELDEHIRAIRMSRIMPDKAPKTPTGRKAKVKEVKIPDSQNPVIVAELFGMTVSEAQEFINERNASKCIPGFADDPDGSPGGTP
jgi:hypothetical protein